MVDGAPVLLRAWRRRLRAWLLVVDVPVCSAPPPETPNCGGMSSPKSNNGGRRRCDFELVLRSKARVFVGNRRHGVGGFYRRLGLHEGLRIEMGFGGILHRDDKLMTNMGSVPF